MIYSITDIWVKYKIQKCNQSIVMKRAKIILNEYFAAVYIINLTNNLKIDQMYRRIGEINSNDKAIE